MANTRVAGYNSAVAEDSASILSEVVSIMNAKIK